MPATFAPSIAPSPLAFPFLTAPQGLLPAAPRGTLLSTGVYGLPIGPGYAAYSPTYNMSIVGGLDANGNACAITYEGSYQLSRKVLLWVAAGTDWHAVPSFLFMRPDSTSNAGKIVSALCFHNGSLYTNITTAAGDPRSWAGWSAALETNAVFSYLFQANDTAKTCLLLYTKPVSGGTLGWGYRTCTDGVSWGAFNWLYKPGGTANIQPIARPVQDLANPSNIHWILAANLTGTQYYFLQQVQSDGSMKFFNDPRARVGDDITSTLGTGWVDGTNFGNTTVSDSTAATGGSSVVYGGKPAFVYGTYSASGSDAQAIITLNRAQWTGTAWALDTIVRSDTLSTGDGSYAGPDYRAYQDIANVGINLSQSDVNTAYVGVAASANQTLPWASGAKLTTSLLQVWKYSGGSWSKSLDFSNPSTNNYTVALVPGAPADQVIYNPGSYTGYTAITGDTWVYPPVAVATSKPISPTWNSSAAPLGTTSYFLLNEGTGGNNTPIADITGAVSGCALVNAVPWNIESFGPSLGPFDGVSGYVQINSAAAAWAAAPFPKGFGVWAKNSSTASTITMLMLGASGNSFTRVSLRANFGSTGLINYTVESDDGVVQVSATSAIRSEATDGKWHWYEAWSVDAAHHYLTVDGVAIANSATNLGAHAVTPNWGTIGAYRNSAGTAGNTFWPGRIGAVLFFSGSNTLDSSVTHSAYAANDIATGQFGGTQGLIASSGTGAVILASLTAAGTGTAGSSPAATGTGAGTLGAIVAAGTGTFLASGTGAGTLGAIVAAGTGTALPSNDALGTGAVILGALTASGVGSFGTSGVGSVLLAGLSASGSGVASPIVQLNLYKFDSDLTTLLP